MNLVIKNFGRADYQAVWEQMQDYTQQRSESSPDQLWIVEHPPVYTQGQAGKPEHVLNPNNIPIIQSDRGGQVTYHGPGQVVAYVLIDLKRKGIGIKRLVSSLETAVIQLLSDYAIDASIQCGAPGVYVNDKKICSIGLRVKRGCSYHGIALNVDMDLLPFKGINPCGFKQLEMTQVKDFVDNITLQEVISKLIIHFKQELAYNCHGAIL